MTTFGSFIKERRLKAGLGLREMAREIGIAAAYMSDIESDKRYPPDLEKLKKFAKVLKLDKKQADTMYDLAGKKRNEAPPDLVDYIAKNKKVRETLRLARDKGMENSDWEKIKGFIETK